MKRSNHSNLLRDLSVGLTEENSHSCCGCNVCVSLAQKYFVTIENSDGVKMGLSFPNTYKKQYRKMLGEVAKHYDQLTTDEKSGLTTFWPMIGSEFKQGSGLLLLGKSVNGWADRWKNKDFQTDFP